ncbi:hypothetical protein P3S68_030907 [Capsicum galapagoense]
METLKKHLLVSGQEGEVELKKIVVRFEEEIYTAATCQLFACSTFFICEDCRSRHATVLFNYNNRELHGIYEVASSEKMNVNPYGWTSNGSGRTLYPTQLMQEGEEELKKIVVRFKEEIYTAASQAALGMESGAVRL